MIVASIGTAKAESILFPYIANTTGALDTIISVIQTSSTATQLHYRYFTKDAAAANSNVNPCNEFDFFRPTTQDDIVSFAVGKNTVLNSGNAMFGDLTDYNSGVGAPNFGHIHGSGRFGLLMVTTADSNADISVFSPLPSAPPSFGPLPMEIVLDGEATLYDIATGAMWGYRGLPSNADGAVAGTIATINSYAFSWPANPATGPLGATTHVLWENNDPAVNGIDNLPKVNIYPPNQFTGRLFVTPVMAGSATQSVAADADMRNPNNKTTHVALINNVAVFGVFDRNENPVSGDTGVDVRCVARVDLSQLTGGVLSALSCPAGPLCTTGGWAFLDLTSPGAISVAPAVPASLAANDNAAAVMDLKFGAITGASTG